MVAPIYLNNIISPLQWAKYDRGHILTYSWRVLTVSGGCVNKQPLAYANHFFCAEWPHLSDSSHLLIDQDWVLTTCGGDVNKHPLAYANDNTFDRQVILNRFPVRASIILPLVYRVQIYTWQQSIIVKKHWIYIHIITPILQNSILGKTSVL